MVQRRAARFVTADYRRRHSVTLLLNQLQWQTLLQRRTHSKVTMLYRIHHQLVAIPASPPYIIFSSTTNRGHHLQLQQHHCRIKSYQHSFFPSVVNLWNQLPSDTVGAASLNLFQNRLASLTLRLAHLFYAYFTHGPNKSASAQYDNTRGAWLTQEGCTLMERKERKVIADTT